MVQVIVEEEKIVVSCSTSNLSFVVRRNSKFGFNIEQSPSFCINALIAST